ncbi:hypothetical protein SARC_13162 [Sphaeroforma arctica JP610]|uniref:Uncharacterized protein n=1 Tax=Sphaeroforma arctica JP610 TaxID=667725 RepID=A0A0L0FC03_9EUKA|nr:hypothetical protein SARC_13162 [Sphaeroforma arctica JP610]KNC74285.1 hypothetical protein SARC_13162 [Sphaeroforma arctica JP610]|eukprot:XP_014148187.1 hypothetical protein SARC_13162 [Sphaeroforma arctica JP610]
MHKPRTNPATMKQFTQAVMLSALVTLANSQPTNSAVDETAAADTDVGSSTSFLPCSTTTNVTAEDADTSPRGYVRYGIGVCVTWG